MNDYRQKGITRTLSDDELLDALATFVQLALFPSTPAHALTAVARTVGRGRCGDAAESAPSPARPRM